MGLVGFLPSYYFYPVAITYSHNIKWRRDGSQYKYGYCGGSDEPLARVQRHVLVLYGRVPQAQYRYEPCPDEPAGPCQETEDNEHGDHGYREGPVHGAYERVDQVAAVELAKRQEVHGSHEHAYPPGKCDGVEHYIMRRGERPYGYIGKQLEYQRRAETERAFGRIPRDNR